MLAPSSPADKTDHWHSRIRKLLAHARSSAIGILCRSGHSTSAIRQTQRSQEISLTLGNDEACFPLFGSKVAEPIGGCHSTIHQEVAAGDEGAVRTHQECPNSPNLIWSACASCRRYFKHAPIAWAPGPLQLVIGEWCDDDAGTNRIDPRTALSPADCLCHHAQGIAALRNLISVQ